MPSVVAWLNARPHNAVFALVFAMLMPGLAMVSGAILMLLVLQQDWRIAAIVAAFATAVLLAVAFALGSSPQQVSIQIASLWLPVLGLAIVMRAARSLTLTLQLAVLVVVVGAGLFIALSSDLVGFWERVIAADPLLQGMQEPLQEWKTAIGATDLQFAGVMTTMYAIGFWFGLVVVVLLGYWMYSLVPGNSLQYGRFRDLNFGRVVAVLLAVTSVAGFVVDAVWVQSTAFVLFAVFWLQGIALVHWYRSIGALPAIALTAAYALTIFLPQFVFPALAVFGYTDAWFDYRSRVKTH